MLQDGTCRGEDAGHLCPGIVMPHAVNHSYFDVVIYYVLHDGEETRGCERSRDPSVFPFSLVIGSVNATMNRSSLVLLGAVTLTACVDLGVQHGVPSISIQPVLDSVFVGDRTLAHRVTYFDEN